MTIFGNYSRYYDLLYQDKDYAGEVQFIHQLIQTHAPQAKSMLELGCGTGRHAALLAELGYSVLGIDQSAEMLTQAQQRASTLPTAIGDRLRFSQGDLRKINLGEQFDVITALFHVVSYQTSNQDLLDTFATVKNHLKPGGIFIFDVWYGPAVLSDRPTVRVKRLEDEKIQVTRIAEPTMYPNDNLVDVNYHIFIKNKDKGNIDELNESHKMRYLFHPEINLLCLTNRLHIQETKEWISKNEPSYQTWNTYYIIKA